MGVENLFDLMNFRTAFHPWGTWRFASSQATGPHYSVFILLVG